MNLKRVHPEKVEDGATCLVYHEMVGWMIVKRQGSRYSDLENWQGGSYRNWKMFIETYVLPKK
jgi:hypothetical protein